MIHRPAVLAARCEGGAAGRPRCMCSNCRGQLEAEELRAAYERPSWHRKEGLIERALRHLADFGELDLPRREYEQSGWLWEARALAISSGVAGLRGALVRFGCDSADNAAVVVATAQELTALRGPGPGQPLLLPVEEIDVELDELCRRLSLLSDVVTPPRNLALRSMGMLLEPAEMLGPMRLLAVLESAIAIGVRVREQVVPVAPPWTQGPTAC